MPYLLSIRMLLKNAGLVLRPPPVLKQEMAIIGIFNLVYSLSRPTASANAHLFIVWNELANDGQKMLLILPHHHVSRIRLDRDAGRLLEDPCRDIPSLA